MNTDGSQGVFPEDRYDKVLVSNVSPPDWSNPEPSGRYNLVVVGAGTAGLVTAAGAAALGAKVALVENHFWGGDCLNHGCVPSKAVIRSARMAEDVRMAGDFGIRIPEGVAVDFSAVMERIADCDQRSVSTIRQNASGISEWLSFLEKPGSRGKIPWKWAAKSLDSVRP